jgi:hypothetical protein
MPINKNEPLMVILLCYKYNTNLLDFQNFIIK